MKPISAIVFAAVVAAGASAAYGDDPDPGSLTTEPEFTGLTRTVSGNDLVSDHDPSAVLRFDPAFRYVGGQKFVLYGVADTEQHFFIETAADGTLKSLYWVQYEAYLADNDYSYDYDNSPLRVTLGDLEFYTNTDIVHSDPNEPRRPGSDGAMARQFMKSKGYLYPSDSAFARLVYLTDETRRKELMIIFIDALEETYGVTAAELVDGGAKASQRAKVEQAHIDRIRDTLDVIQR